MLPSEILSDPSKWTRNTYARSSNGDPCDVRVGTCFCMYGAAKACGMDVVPFSDKLAALIRARYPQRMDDEYDAIVSFNDHPDTTYEEVIAILKEVGL